MDAMCAFLKEAGRHPLLTKDQERELIRRAQAGCLESRDKMVLSNLRLVASIARTRAQKTVGIELEELVHEGTLGLIRAVEKFDLDMTTRFSTYASFWVRQFIRTKLLNRYLVHVPFYMQEPAKRRLHPFAEQNAEAALAACRAPTRDVKDGEDMYGMDLETIPARDDDEYWRNVAEHHDKLQRVMDEVLDDRERKLMKMRYQDHKTLGQIAVMFRLSKERVRQIQEGAVAKLREATKEVNYDWAG